MLSRSNSSIVSLDIRLISISIVKHLSPKCQKCKEQEPSRDHKFSILENVAFLRDCTSATLPHFEVALVGARPLYLAAQDRAATQTPRWGVRCFANAVLLGRACPKPCWKRVRQAESSSSPDSNPFLGAISRFQKQTVQGLGKSAVIAL